MLGARRTAPGVVRMRPRRRSARPTQASADRGAGSAHPQAGVNRGEFFCGTVDLPGRGSQSVNLSSRPIVLALWTRVPAAPARTSWGTRPAPSSRPIRSRDTRERSRGVAPTGENGRQSMSRSSEYVSKGGLFSGHASSRDALFHRANANKNKRSRPIRLAVQPFDSPGHTPLSQPPEKSGGL